MATAVYLVSPRAYTGKSLLTYALGNDARQRGKQLAYFKPIGPHPVTVQGVTTDLDALAITRYWNLELPLDAVCPVVLTEVFHQRVLSGDMVNLLPTVRDAFTRVSAGADVVLVGGMGSLFSTGMAYGLPAWTLADALDARTLVVSRFEPERTVDELLAARHLLGARMAGAVINAVRPSQREHILANDVAFLERHGVPIFGVLPEDAVLHAIPISELVRGLNAQVLTGQDQLDELVERFSIGAMHEEAALSYFRKSTNKGVITGGDRSDLQRAALETSTKVLILTGGIYPANIILSFASERNVPVLLVYEDTLATVERIETMLGHLRISQPRQIEHAEKVVGEHVDVNRLWEAFGG